MDEIRPRPSFPLSDKEGLNMDEPTKTPASPEPAWSRRSSSARPRPPPPA
ncbi:MAG: hypothetical protein MZV64_67925 [Ignavibacteriales bacterium]|nr:hypothetical protein [Ignavibacteriales bacterium]